MKLYHTPGACSTASRIVLEEAGIAVEPVEVNLRDKTLPDGTSFLEVNPKGQVPALVLGSGEVLTEGAVIMQYIADQAPASGLLPPPGKIERYRVLEWTNYIATELHKSFSPLNRPNTPPEFREIVKTALLPRVFGVLNQRLAARDYLAGDSFSIADAYAFVILSWTRPQEIDLSAWPNIQTYLKRIADRPAVKAVM
ncbi:glutathione transferase GstA [Agrobacterium tumefaciens]|uniref:glutathione transferase GstA n=1 Tax=Agrobacterium TaxID=357 RepID=UPI0012956C2F|nr:glutathione transferase GstA [Agrobacterium sp. ICMP 6402]MQB12286.1 glutathione transferase GstA [Agrobacterium sp. ICMP 6402]NTA61796.1 glutathione transferase GstA [Agrobacterium tumefaciens]